MQTGVTNEEGKLVCFQDEPSSTWSFYVGPEITDDLARLYFYDKTGQKILPIRPIRTEVHDGTVHLTFTRNIKGVLILMTHRFLDKSILKEMVEALEVSTLPVH